jgi:hemolysin III
MGFIGLGGVFYALGAVIYARRPTWACLKSGWFEFHEVFHGFTVIAYCLQFGAIYMIVS